jgi:hypothetical protein
MRRPASLITAILLFIIAGAQLTRVFFQIEIVAGGVAIPYWPNIIAALVLTSLAVWLLTERRKP